MPQAEVDSVSAASTQHTRAALVVIAAAFVFVGGIFFFIGGRSLLDAWRYGRGLRAEAAATGKALRFATDTTGTTYELSYRAALEGRLLERTETVRVHLWERAEQGSLVEVEYLRGDPESVRVVQRTDGEHVRSTGAMAVGVVMIVAALAMAARAIRPRRSAQTRAPRPEISVIPLGADKPSTWSIATRSSDFWIGAIFLVVSLPIVAVTILQISLEWSFFRNGVSTDAMILTKEIQRSGRGHRSASYEATYRFMVPEGTFEGRAALPYAGWARLKERQAAEVLYLSDRPSTNRLAGPRPWMWPTLVAALGLVFFAIGTTFLVRSIRHAFRDTGTGAPSGESHEPPAQRGGIGRA